MHTQDNAQKSAPRRFKGEGSVYLENEGQPNERYVATTSRKWQVEHGLDATREDKKRSDPVRTFSGSAAQKRDKARAQAIARREAFQQLVISGEVTQVGRPDALGVTGKPIVTVADWIERWLEVNVKPVFDRKGVRVSGSQQRTYHNYAYILRAYALHSRYGIGHLKLATLQASQIEDWKVAMQRAGVGSSSVHKALVVLGTSLQVAFKRQAETHLRFNPVRLIDNPKPRTTKKVPPDLGFISQLRQLSQGHLYAFAIDLALGLGLRRGEVAALRFSDFDFLAGTLTLHGRVVRYPGQAISTTRGLKARDERIEEQEVLPLPLGAPWARLLEAHRTRVLEFHMLHRKLWKGTDPREQDAYVFPTQTGGPIDPHYLTRWFRELADQVGPQHIDKTFHWLRHTFVNQQFKANRTLEQVAALARHKDQTVTIQVYRHMDEQERTALFAASADWLYADQQDVAIAD